MAAGLACLFENLRREKYGQIKKVVSRPAHGARP
jgi:hypothetical protein